MPAPSLWHLVAQKYWSPKLREDMNQRLVLGNMPRLDAQGVDQGGQAGAQGGSRRARSAVMAGDVDEGEETAHASRSALHADYNDVGPGW